VLLTRCKISYAQTLCCCPCCCPADDNSEGSSASYMKGTEDLPRVHLRIVEREQLANAEDLSCTVLFSRILAPEYDSCSSVWSQSSFCLRSMCTVSLFGGLPRVACDGVFRVMVARSRYTSPKNGFTASKGLAGDELLCADRTHYCVLVQLSP
jgi:hypothetical protein